MNCNQVEELLEAYALEALDADERLQVEQHLLECPDCQALANELADVANSLPQALAIATASSLQPPAAIKARLLQKLETSPVTSAAPGEAAPVAKHQAMQFSPTDGNARQNRRRKLRWPWLSPWQPRTVGMLAVVLILLVLSVAWGARLSIVLAQERALRNELASLVEQQEVVLEVVDSDQTVRRVLLSPEPVDSSAPPYGKVFTRPDLSHVVAMAARLPQPPAGQAYHLWLTSDKQIKLAGVMAVNEQGFGLLVFEADRNGPTYDLAQVTLQPEGSILPSEDPILIWAPSD